jgi:PKD repeat protein
MRILVNAPPTADAGEDRVAAIGEVVSFDATGSSDSDGELTSFSWDFGNGARARTAVAETLYWEKGVYTVSLEVRDNSGLSNGTASDSVQIEIIDPPNLPPRPDPGPPRTVHRGEPAWFDASDSEDPDGNLISYEWDFGDGTRASGYRRHHSYWQNGIYELRLTVRDDSGLANAAASATAVVTVVDPPNRQPQADAGPDRSVLAGEVVTFDGSASEDTDGNLIAYEWDFGDGGRAKGVAPIHTFWEPGEYLVTLLVRDNSGLDNATAVDEAAVSVARPDNIPPVADAGEPRSAEVGEPIIFDASGSHDPDGAILTYAWAFGDGAVSSGVSPVYTYQEPGEYLVRLTVLDNSGRENASGMDEITVSVTPKPAGASQSE